MTNKTYNFNFSELNLLGQNIETVLGYQDGDDREFVSGLIEEILSESVNISNIKSQYTIFDVVHLDTVNKSLVINSVNFAVKNIVFGQLKKSGSIAVFLCTAGAEIGIRSRKAMQERDFLRAYVYDIVGSEIVEAAADLMQADLEKSLFEKGEKITNRYSPGYCGWDVGEQHKLFSLIPENYCGIKLTDSALMYPVKSVSGFIGIGKNVNANPYTCRMCRQDDCVYRRVRESKRMM